MKSKKAPITKKSYENCEGEIDFDKINELIDNGEALNEISKELNVSKEYLKNFRVKPEDEIYKWVS